MRRCPDCRVDFQVVQTRFAEVDVCSQCGGVFLDPGEGVALFGSDADGSFLVGDGIAKRVRDSRRSCPAEEHAPSIMSTYAMSARGRTIEFEHCAICRGVFLDDGEGAALQALDALDASDIVASTGARFAAPPPEPRDAQNAAVDRAREERGRSFFAAFFSDLATAAATTATTVGAEVVREQRRARWYRRR